MTTNAHNLHDDLLSLGLDEAIVSAWLADNQKLGQKAYTAASAATLNIWWQDEAKLAAVCDELGYSQAIAQVFLDACQQIKLLPEQLATAWWSLLGIASNLYTASDSDLRLSAFRRPGPPADRWGVLATLFAAMIQFTALDKMIAYHRQLGIPAKVTQTTADDLPLRMEEYHLKHGQWGTTDFSGWFNYHLRGKLFMLGRLQFIAIKLDLPCTILLNKQGQHAALAPANKLIRSDGLYACADHNAAANAPDNWTTTFTQNPQQIQGHCINELGRVERQLSTFELDHWQIHIQPGDSVLAVHIPARGRLESAACVDSFKQAQAFFPTYFPQNAAELTPKCFTCVSWLMDPQLTLLQDGKSNLGQFIKLFHSVPTANANDNQMFERVFNGHKELEKLPRDNSLRSALIQQMELGQKWRVSGGFRLFE